MENRFFMDKRYEYLAEWEIGMTIFGQLNSIGLELKTNR